MPMRALCARVAADGATIARSAVPRRARGWLAKLARASRSHCARKCRRPPRRARANFPRFQGRCARNLGERLTSGGGARTVCALSAQTHSCCGRVLLLLLWRRSVVSCAASGREREREGAELVGEGASEREEGRDAREFELAFKRSLGAGIVLFSFLLPVSRCCRAVVSPSTHLPSLSGAPPSMPAGDGRQSFEKTSRESARKWAQVSNINLRPIRTIPNQHQTNP